MLHVNSYKNNVYKKSYSKHSRQETALNVIVFLSSAIIQNLCILFQHLFFIYIYQDIIIRVVTY